MGTSHRQAPVRDLVGRVRSGLAELFSLPDGYEVVLGNGGATAFWDVATARPDRAEEPAPVLRRVLLEVRLGGEGRAVARRPVGDRSRARARAPVAVAEDGVDAYAWAHNETSTAVMAPVVRPAGADDGRAGADRRHLRRRRPAGRPRRVRRLLLRAAEVASPPTAASGSRSFSPAALERAESIAASDRHIPAFFDLPTAIDNSRKNQTYNTPVGRHALPDGRAAGLDERLGGLNGDGRADHAVLGRPLRLGREVAVRLPLRRRPGPPLAGDRHHRLRGVDRRRRASPPSCAPTASSTPSPTASSAATSCGSRCTPPSTPPTSRPSPPASTGSSSASEASRWLSQVVEVRAERASNHRPSGLMGSGCGSAVVTDRKAPRAGEVGSARRCRPAFRSALSLLSRVSLLHHGR